MCIERATERAISVTLAAHERSVEAALLVGMGFVPSAVGLDRPAEMIVPERGVRVSELGHRGLAGVGTRPLRGQCLGWGMPTLLRHC